MKRISALTMRKQFGKYLDLVAKKREPVLISRANEPMVVMIPADAYDEYRRIVEERAELEEVGREMDALRERIRARIGHVDVEGLVRTIRDSNGRPRRVRHPEVGAAR